MAVLSEQVRIVALAQCIGRRHSNRNLMLANEFYISIIVKVYKEEGEGIKRQPMP